jgi:aspartate-semialdehyde dehydrogenase
MLKVGFVGWRGMVGSVLMDRMNAENDFAGIEPVFFSTSQVGQDGPDVGAGSAPLKDAFDIDTLSTLDIIVTSQGGSYTREVHGKLRDAGWKGFWIDAASALRMEDDAVIVLDPVNREVIDRSLVGGIKNYVGGNCTVSLMLMAVGVLFQKGLIEWMTSMTYQAASGAGAKNMRELVAQMAAIGSAAKGNLEEASSAILDLDRAVGSAMSESSFPVDAFGAPLAGSLLPWIDCAVEKGMTREEWKGFAETNKILGNENPVPVDGLCVRIGAMRSHSQALTIKLTKDIPLDEIESMIGDANQWVSVVPNTKEESIAKLTPAAISGTLNVPVGRIHKMNMGPKYLTAFTVGDQLLWGAAEPVRRMLTIVREHLES